MGEAIPPTGVGECSNRKWEIMKKLDLAYIAGLFDGEGCIRITRSKSKTYRTRIAHRIECQLSMANAFLPKLFQFHFGGNYGGKKVKEGNQSQWYWMVTSFTAAEFLKAILPYLKIKREEAKLALDFQKRIPPRGTHKLTTDDDFVLREADFILMKSLKRKADADSAIAKQEYRK